jgi:hypothetical protein
LTQGPNYALTDLAYLSMVLERMDGGTFKDLEGRIAVQKKIYLLQASGVDLGYSFEWNNFGPYSPELAEDCTSLKAYMDEASELGRRLRPKPEVEKSLTSLTRRISPPRPLRNHLSAWLELLSSCHMLAAQRFPATAFHALSEKQRGEIEQDVKTRKPHLAKLVPDELYACAWRALDNLVPIA